MLKKTNIKINYETGILVFFIIYLICGCLIFKDFGVGIEEHFQRKNGFFWLNKLLSFTGFEELKSTVNFKYNEILRTNPNLPDINFFNFYGVVFDFPLALLESSFSINSSKIYFELRHLFIFLIFFISSIYFYKILYNRFNNGFLIFLGTVFYIFTPRIFGDSFHNNKDILFLSLMTISTYYVFNLFEKKDNKNLLLFCLFAALATSSRIMGLVLPFFLLFFLLIELLTKKIDIKVFITLFLKIILFYLFFLYLHYPYIWQLNIFDISSWFSSFFYHMDIKILFNGEYYNIKYLPRSYLLIWIFITTPFYIIIFSMFGFLILLRRVFLRLLNINELKIINSDLWQGNNEKKDVFIFILFLSFFLFATFLNVAMLSGWRHFYFLHLCLTYFSIIGINFLLLNLRKKIKKSYLLFIGFLIISALIHVNFKFHPYQSVYFNNFLKKETIKDFQVDTASLSRADALKYILEKAPNDDQINIANISWVPLENGKSMLDENDQKKFVFTGQNYESADFIYTNYIFKSDEKYNKNYKLPNDFKRFKTLMINNIEIYTIFKRIK